MSAPTILALLLAACYLWLAARIALHAGVGRALADFRRRHNICRVVKDGGPESRVWGYFLFEFKGIASVVLLRFEDGTCDAYHSQAFHAISWLLSGVLFEDRAAPKRRAGFFHYLPSLYPIFTARSDLHQVHSGGRSWVLSLRGPWSARWVERTPDGNTTVLTSDRVAVATVTTPASTRVTESP